MSTEGKRPGTDASRRMVGGFQVLEEIGRGAMATVFKARQVSVDRIVALKILPPHLARNADFVRRFLREGRAAAKLSHTNIVRAIDAGQAGPYYYFAMEYVDGTTVDSILQARGALPEKRSLEVARDIARALDHAHEAGLIHRDIKPANILIARDGTVKLADLGLARQTDTADTHLTQAGMVVGTPNYMSPEQTEGGRPLDERSDIYSLGATLYHMVTGQVPYPAGTAIEVMYKHIHEAVPDPRAVRPEVSAATAAILRKTLDKDPAQRYQRARDLAADLTRAIEKRPGLLALRPPTGARQAGTPATLPAAAEPAAESVPVEQETRSGSRIIPIAAGAVAAAAVLLAVVLALTLGGRPGPRAGTGTTAQRPTTQPAAASSSYDQKLVEYLTQWMKDHPTDYAEGVRKLELALKDMKSPAFRMQVEDALAEWKKAYNAAADRAFSTLSDAVRKIADSGDYDGAITECAKVPRDFADLLAGRARQAAAALKAEAETKIKDALAAASKLSDATEPDKALAELDKVKGVKYAALAADLAKLRERIVEEVKYAADSRASSDAAAAGKRVDKLADDIEAAARKADFTEIARLADAARKDETLKPALPQLSRVLAVAAAFDAMRAAELADPAAALKQSVGRTVTLHTKLGPQTGVVKEATADAVLLEKTYSVGGEEKRRTVEVRIADLTPEGVADLKPKWAPKTSDDQIAVALLAAGSGDLAALEAAVKAAGDHPLGSRGFARFVELKLAARETEAERDWEKSIGPYMRKGKLTDEEELARIKALDAYLAKHTGTKFAGARWPEIGTIRNAPRERDAQEAWSRISPYAAKAGLTPAQAAALAKAIDEFQDKHRGTNCVKGAQKDIAALEDKILPHMPGRRFDSKLELAVGLYDPSGRLDPHVTLDEPAARFLGSTPSKEGKGFNIPPGAVWFVIPRDLKALTDEQLKAIAAEIQKKDITGLSLWEAGLITGDGFAVLAPCTKLRMLVLGRTQFSDAAMAQLAGLTNLEALDLYETHGFTDAGMQHLRGLTNLKRLVLHSCGKVTDAGLDNLKGLTRLEALCLSYHGGITSAGLASIENLTELKYLELGFTGVRDDGLAHLRQLGKLELLNMDGNPMTDKGLAHLAGLTKLRVLCLTGAGMTDGGLVNLKGMTDMETLRLDSAKVTGPGLAHLAKMARLKYLSLSRSAVTDEGLAHLAGLTQLEELVLAECPALTDAGLAHLENLAQLRTLNLAGDPEITDAGLAHLKPLRWLRSLNVSKTKVTDRGVDELKIATPALSIDR